MSLRFDPDWSLLRDFKTIFSSILVPIAAKCNSIKKRGLHLKFQYWASYLVWEPKIWWAHSIPQAKILKTAVSEFLYFTCAWHKFHSCQTSEPPDIILIPANHTASWIFWIPTNWIIGLANNIYNIMSYMLHINTQINIISLTPNICQLR